MKKSILLSAIVLLLVWACSHKVKPGTETTKTKEKAKVVTYASDIKYLVDTKCTPCHIPARGGFKTSLDSYSAMKTYISDAIERVQLSTSDSKYMPFKKSPLTSSEIQLLKSWRDGGMIEN